LPVASNSTKIMAASKTTPTTILDPAQFARVEYHTINGRPDRSATHKSMRIAVPLSIQSVVNTALIYDPRKIGSKPTEIDVYSHLVGLGYDDVEETIKAIGRIGIPEQALTVPGCDKVVLWLPFDLSENVRLQFKRMNIERQDHGLPKIRSIEGYIIALLWRGIAKAKTITAS